MKNSKQIAEAVLKERDKAQEKNKARNRRIKRVSSCMSVAFVFLTVVLGAKHFDSSQIKTPSMIEDSFIYTEPASSANDVILHEGTDAVSEEDHVQRESSTKASTAKDRTNTTVVTKANQAGELSTFTANQHQTKCTLQNSSLAASNTTVSSKEEIRDVTNTKATKETDTAETIIVPKWDERTLSERFMEFAWNGITYGTRDCIIARGSIGSKLGLVTMTGKDIYQNEEYSIRAEVFCINAISDHCAVAIQFEGYDSYYVYTNRNYCPGTLGELVDDLVLIHTLTFGSLKLGESEAATSNNDAAIIMNQINASRTSKNLSNSIPGTKLFCVSVNVELLGIQNKYLAVTKEGDIETNLMEWCFTFYIGADKAQEIADEFDMEQINETTTELEPIQEDIYEE